MCDLTGVPIYYVNEIRVEDHGTGHLRYITGCTIGSQFVPQYVAVIPMDAVVIAYGNANKLINDIRAAGH